MKINAKISIICFVLIFIGHYTKSQVAVNSDGSSPDGSAMIDISSTSGGILIPRMLESERDAIASPATGLMIFQTDGEQGFFYYNGLAWLYIGYEGNDPWTRSGTKTVLTNISDSVGIGTSSPNMTLSVNGYATSANFVSTILLWQASSAYYMNNTSGMDLSNCESALEPSIYEPNGNIEVKLVVRFNSSTGTNNFQLRAHNGSTESWPIVNTDSWTFASTQSGGVATSPWKTWNAGTNAYEIHLFGWSDASSDINITSAYLLIRPAQP